MEGVRRDLFTTEKKFVNDKIEYTKGVEFNKDLKFPRKKSQNGRMLGKIFHENRCGRMATNGQFMSMYIGRYGARITDLRGMGWKISSQKISQGKFGYSIDKEQRIVNYDKLEEYNGN
tara:strand:- start:416 stop:769 length:354 start_codon:yes stop_codon:yes gene_type:complete